MRTPIIASEGKVLTNGEIYGKVIFLGNGLSIKDFTEIDVSEFQEIERRKEENDKNSLQSF